jgi:hypothetical protein
MLKSAKKRPKIWWVTQKSRSLQPIIQFLQTFKTEIAY